MIKIINDVLTKEDCFSLYTGLVTSNIWNLSRQSDTSNLGGCFPGVTLIENQEIVYNNQYWIGYFNSLFDRINAELKRQHNFSISRVISRIALNAQNDNHYTQFHQDMETNTYSIVGFFTPQWDEDWGGELNIEGDIIKYNPGDFILFESTKLHKSEPIKKIPYWRTSVNYVIKKQ
jgi:hypothetical protein